MAGYPGFLDDTEYLKADRGVYVQLAPRIDSSDSIDAVSIEDAHTHNDLAELLPLFTRTTVV